MTTTRIDRTERTKEVLRLIKKYEHKVKPSGHGWTYCKYCYKDVRPIVNWDPGIMLVQCSECHYGLWPLQSEADIQTWIEIGDWKRRKNVK